MTTWCTVALSAFGRWHAEQQPRPALCDLRCMRALVRDDATQHLSHRPCLRDTLRRPHRPVNARAIFVRERAKKSDAAGALGGWIGRRVRVYREDPGDAWASERY